MKPAEDYVSTSLRVPASMHEALREAAKQAERSFNGEVVARLRLSLEQDIGRADKDRQQ